jgi:hypothetical protein
MIIFNELQSKNLARPKASHFMVSRLINEFLSESGPEINPARSF